MQSKTELRDAVRQRLLGMDETLLRSKSSAICAHIVAQPEWDHKPMIGLYAAQPREPNVDPLALGQRKLFCYPRVSGRELHFYRAAASDALSMGRWQIREPPALPENRVEPDQIDLLLVPGVAFTRDGCRLGRGGGFYDRLLAAPGFRATTFGICFEEQLADHLPLEAHDFCVDRVISA